MYPSETPAGSSIVVADGGSGPSVSLREAREVAVLGSGLRVIPAGGCKYWAYLPVLPLIPFGGGGQSADSLLVRV